MNIEIFEATTPEQLYTFTQSSQIASQTGCLGHLRADFGEGGTEFHTSWEEHCGDLKTDEFKALFNEIIEELRNGTENGKLLSSRANLARFCFRHPTATIVQAKDSTAYRFDVGDYAYLMRLNSNRGDYNVYIYVYIADWLDKHLREAERGIRFIDPHYNELFRMPDGGQVRLTYRDGKSVVRTSRYIDDYHAEIGSSLYHICEFAEMCEQSGIKVEPVTPIIQNKSREIHDKGDEAR
ncbi:MAG: hypothetical protein IJQ80_00250 [Clostridia bacterium]|nr:hypothetical protein [Clostridia bacterium]